MIGITKRFPGVLANDNIDLDIEAGEVHALLGENGAGKSTLMTILYGLYRKDEGQILWKGEPYEPRDPQDAIARGIGMVHQHSTLIQSLSVAENIVLGQHSTSGPFYDAGTTETLVATLCAEYDIPVDPRERVENLARGTQQWIEILRALSRGVELLILDEPTSALTPQEADRLFITVRKLAEQGKSVCFITHKLDEVMATADRVTVLRDGRHIGTVARQDTDPRALARMMVGRDLPGVIKKEAQAGECVLRLEDVSAVGETQRGSLKSLSLSLYGGEILGVAGVAGNGQTELADVITGLRKITAGRIYVRETDISGFSPRKIIEQGVAYIPDKPRQNAVFMAFDLEDNVVLGNQWAEPMAQSGILRPREIRARAQQVMEQYDVKAPSTRALTRQLSGGNLQKLVLGRELSCEPDVIVAVNPTAGLDVAACVDIRSRLVQERDRGVGVLMISADLDEIFEISDRIAVLYNGEIVGDVPADEADLEEIGLMMAGAKAPPSS